MTDASKLDEWRWSEAKRRAGRSAREYPGVAVVWAEAYRRLVREDVRPPAGPKTNTNMETMIYDRDCEIERLTAEVAALRMAAEPDQDTRDLREIMAEYADDGDGQEGWLSGKCDEWPETLRARQALTTIKARVRDEEREAVCKWLRDKSLYSNTTFHLDAAALERGEHHA